LAAGARDDQLTKRLIQLAEDFEEEADRIEGGKPA
jgi:hypothetical protein